MDILGFGLAGNNNKNLVPKLIRASTGQDGRTSEVLRKAFCIGSHPRVCRVKSPRVQAKYLFRENT